MRFHFYYLFLPALIISSILFTLAALSDFFYSDCLAIGTGFMTCTNGAAILAPMVTHGNYWYLTPFMMPYGDTISQTMGRVAGISFLFIFGSFFLWDANRSGKGKSIKIVGKAFAEAIVFNAIVYSIFMLGVVTFLPYCLPGSCRISDAVYWINYQQGFYISAIAISSYVLARVWQWIFKLRMKVKRARILNLDPPSLF